MSVNNSIDNWMMGTTTTDNAAAGAVGEIIESTVVLGSAVSLTTATVAAVTSIILTPGDWQVFGNVFFVPAATTVITNLIGSISFNSFAHPTAPGAGAFANYSLAFPLNSVQGFSVGQRRISTAGATIYLAVSAVFITSTLAAYGYIGARRAR